MAHYGRVKTTMKSKRYEHEITIRFTAESDREANQKMLELIALAANKTMIISSKGKIKKLAF